MDKKAELKQRAKHAVELLFLVGLFVVGGILLPIYLAPTVVEVLPITTPKEASLDNISISVENRNVSNGELFFVTVSDPAARAQIKSLSYPCSFTDVNLAYQISGETKELPCDTAVYLPQSSSHELLALAENQSIVYMPITVLISYGDYEGELSVVLAASASGADEKSRLEDKGVFTLSDFSEINR